MSNSVCRFVSSASACAFSAVDICQCLSQLRRTGGLTSPLGLENGRLCLDFGNFLFRLALSSGFTNFTTHASFCNIDTCLVGGSFVSFPRQESEVLRAGSILELLDVGVVDAQTELIELILNVFNDLWI
jgi:hypothetical protein